MFDFSKNLFMPVPQHVRKQSNEYILFVIKSNPILQPHTSKTSSETIIKVIFKCFSMKAMVSKVKL